VSSQVDCCSQQQANGGPPIVLRVSPCAGSGITIGALRLIRRCFAPTPPGHGGMLDDDGVLLRVA
jgi:hypothetical protein